MIKEEIKKIIIENTQYWQPHGEKDSCFIIEEGEPFFWRINPKWAEEVANKVDASIRKDLAEKIRMMKIYDIDDTSFTPIAMHGYNQALSDILKILEK